MLTLPAYAGSNLPTELSFHETKAMSQGLSARQLSLHYEECTDNEGVKHPVNTVIRDDECESRLCLGGFIGRFIGPNQVLAADPGGVIHLPVDLSSLPTALGSTSAAPGETWYFQLWHRDGVAGAVTSNFTDAVSVTFL